MNNYTDFEPLRLELLHFSKYLEFDEEKEGISCPIAIQKLQKEKYKDEEDAKKKYVIAFIVSADKVIRTIKKKLDEFDIELFNDYMYDKKDLRVVAYLFDTGIKQENKAFKQFLGKVSSVNSIFLKIKKFSLEHVFSLATSIGILFSALVTYFVYSGLIAYGIVPQFAVGIHEISFLLSFSLLSIVALIFLIYFFAPIVLPVVLVFGLVGYFKLDLSILTISVLTILTIIIGFILLFIIMKIKPLLIDHLFNEIKNFVSILSISSAFIMFLLVVLLIGGTAILGTMTHDFSKHLGKSNYGTVMDIYRNMYSGYPKILIDNSKDKNNIYYVPFEAGGYYYAYDVDNVKERYFNDLNKTQIQQKLCKKKSLWNEFMETYIIDNPYIKQKYQNKRFSIDDKNVSIEEFNMAKVISVDDINRSLCDEKME